MARRTTKPKTTTEAPVKTTGATSAVRYDGTGLPPARGRLTSAPRAEAPKRDDTPDAGAVDRATPTTGEPVASEDEAAESTTTPEEG